MATATPAHLEEWQDHAGTHDAALHEALRALLAGLQGKADRRVAAAVLLYLAGWLLPEQPEPGGGAMVALVAVVATVPLLMWNVLPMYVVAMLMVISIVLPGVATPAQALAGFSFPSWLMIVALFTVTAAVARSGLLHRLSLLSSERLPANHLIQSLLLSLCGIVLAAGVTGGAPRIPLGVPSRRHPASTPSFR